MQNTTDRKIKGNTNNWWSDLTFPSYTWHYSVCAMFVRFLWPWQSSLSPTSAHTDVHAFPHAWIKKENSPDKEQACLYLIKVNERLLSSACRPAVIWYRSPRSGHQASALVVTLITVVTIITKSIAAVATGTLTLIVVITITLNAVVTAITEIFTVATSP